MMSLLTQDDELADGGGGMRDCDIQDGEFGPTGAEECNPLLPIGLLEINTILSEGDLVAYFEKQRHYYLSRIQRRMKRRRLQQFGTGAKACSCADWESRVPIQSTG